MFGRNAKEYRSWIERKKYMDSMPYNLKVVNTGSTAGYKAFDYRYWNVAGYNLGWQPQTLYYDFETLKKFSRHIKEGAKIFICIEEFKLVVDHYPSPNAVLKYYFILEPKQIWGYDKKTEKKLKSVPCLVNGSLLRSEITGVIKDMFHLQGSLPIFKSLEEKDEYYSSYYLNMWHREFGWQTGNPKLSEIQVNAVKVNSERLKNMLLYCDAHGWKPIVVILPFSPNINGRLPDTILDECLWKPIEKVKEYGYQVLDLFHNKKLNDYRLYEDGLSFNEKGKRIFNQIMQEYV